MSKSRKDQFEEQLKDLQKDISKLSQKLASPPLLDARSNISDIHNTSSASILSDVRSTRSHVSHHDADNTKMVDRLRIELHQSNKERDDATYKLEQAKQEIEQLKRALQETSRLRASLDHLKQDHESLRISLESSERIRRQQKELINLLQRSHAISTATGGIVNPIDITPEKLIDNSLLTHHSHNSASHHHQHHQHHQQLDHQPPHHQSHQQQQHGQQHHSQSSAIKIKPKIKTSINNNTSSASVGSSHRGGSHSINNSVLSNRSKSSKKSTSSSKKGSVKGSKPTAATPSSYSHMADVSYQEILQPNLSLVPPASTHSGSSLHFPIPHSHNANGSMANGSIIGDNMSFISGLGNGSTSRILFDSAPSSRATSRSNSFDVPHSSVVVAPSSSSHRSSQFGFSDSSIEASGSAYPQYPPHPHPLPEYHNVHSDHSHQLRRHNYTAAPTPPRPPSAPATTAATSSSGKPPRHPPSNKKAPSTPLYISTHSAPTSPRHSPRAARTMNTSALKSSLKKKVSIPSPRSLPTYEQYQSLTSHSSGLLSPTRKVKKIRSYAMPTSSVLVGNRATNAASGAGGSPSRLFNVPIPSPATTFGHSDRRL